MVKWFNRDKIDYNFVTKTTKKTFPWYNLELELKLEDKV
jgi:hypothetical protein